jgi:hypothetical protein
MLPVPLPVPVSSIVPVPVVPVPPVVPVWPLVVPVPLLVEPLWPAHADTVPKNAAVHRTRILFVSVFMMFLPMERRFKQRATRTLLVLHAQ